MSRAGLEAAGSAVGLARRLLETQGMRNYRTAPAGLAAPNLGVQSRGGADRVVDLYGAYGAVVYARCRRILGDAAAAEDVTQETFLRLHRQGEAIPDDDGVLPWLYRIATNLSLNALRDGRTRPLLVESLPEVPAASLDELLANRNLARRLITQVPPRLQNAAWLFYVDGMRQEEIAVVLGVSRRTVAGRLAGFLRASRKYLRREGL
jgi:RNA polymerase sigma-70 factor (ECF subfamily)